MERAHNTEDSGLGLRIIQIGSRLYIESMDEKGASKIFVRLLLIGHPIWRHILIWEKAVLKAIRDEIRFNSPLKTMTKKDVDKYQTDLIYS